jgi:hypothetical protein
MLNHERKIAEFRILILRGLTGFFLVATCVICASFGYISLQENEYKIFIHQYHSLINGVSKAVLEGVKARSAAGESFAASFGGFCPSSSDWPNCWIPYSTFVATISPLAKTLTLSLTAMIAIVQPEEEKIASFENFAHETYANESFPLSHISPVIFSVTPSGTVYRSSSGVNPSSPYRILAPVTQIEMAFSSALLYDTHAPGLGDQSKALDDIITCSLNAVSCSAVSDLQELGLSGDGPSTYRFFGIYPANNSSALVGFVSFLVSWEGVFTHGAPSVMTDIDVILRTHTNAFTYHFKDGAASYKGPGDIHEDKFNQYEKIFEIHLPGSSLSTLNYTLTFYPTQRFYDTYHSDTPLLVCVVSLLIVLGTSLIFLTYDFFVKRESLEQTRILEAKQTYVRFISHVSSPLCLPLSPCPS